MQMQSEKLQSDKSLGAILVDTGKLSIKNVEQILKLQKAEQILFGDAGIKLGLLTQQDVQYALSNQYGYPYLLPGDETVSEAMVAAYDPYGQQAEALRTLRNQLMLGRFTGYADSKTLAIVSPDRGEGRSFLAANLAIVFSQLGERTLLIDADLRNPSQHELFKLENLQGLSTVLAGRSGLQAIQRIKNFVDLSVLTAGATPPNPQELLGRPAFTELLNSLNKLFDVILIDTPPAIDFADAQMISARAGAAIVAVRKNFSSIELVRQQVESLTLSGTKVIGTVLSEF
jgi:receptor protein-tyrosine kinase